MEWIKHTQSESPVGETVTVEVRRKDGEQVGPWPALEFDWSERGYGRDIVAYRIVNQSTTPDVSANDIQVAGTHYKQLKIQVWDFIAANRLGFFEGNAIKYLTRWESKGGVDDLRKARHYIDKLIELQEQA
jgi:hypothetical protein